MKKIFSLILCLLLLFTGCSSESASSVTDNVSSTASTPSPFVPIEPHKLVLMQQKLDETSKLGQAYATAYNQALTFAQSYNMEIENVISTEETALEDMIAQAVNGAKHFICIGSIFSTPVELCSKSYNNLNFVIFDGNIPQKQIAKNVLQVSFAYDEAGFIIGYGLVNAGMRNIGFVSEGIDHYENEILKGIQAGAGYAANEINTPQTNTNSSSETTDSSQAVNSISDTLNQKPKASVTIEKYDLSKLTNEQFTLAMDIRKDLKNFRLVCIGNSTANSVTQHPGQFYIFTDSDIVNSRKYIQFSIGGEFDLIPELEKLATAGDGWSTTYGGRTIRLSIAEGNIVFPVFKMSTANLNKAKTILSLPSTDLNSGNFLNGFGYVTQTQYNSAS